MKKFLTKLFTSLCVLSVAIVAVYAVSTTSSCELKPLTRSVSTSAVGVSTKARGYGYCYANSAKPCNFSIYACWTGWPYTCEYSTTMYVGQDPVNHTETQSNDSNFYVELANRNDFGYQTHAYGQITLE